MKLAFQKPAEERRGGGAIEAVVVIQNPDPHEVTGKTC
jgi:hypothetical protein